MGTYDEKTNPPQGVNLSGEKLPVRNRLTPLLRGKAGGKSDK
jgi:hypothetical protein